MAEEKERKVGAAMWVMIVAVVVVVAGAFFGWYGRWGKGVPTDAVQAGKVASEGVNYYGRKVKIYGYVSTPLRGSVLVISDGLSGTATLPVIVKGTGVSIVGTGGEVLVEGTPIAFDSGRLKQDFGVVLPGQVTYGWQGRPVVVAEKVTVVR